MECNRIATGARFDSIEFIKVGRNKNPGMGASGKTGFLLVSDFQDIAEIPLKITIEQSTPLDRGADFHQMALLRCPGRFENPNAPWKLFWGPTPAITGPH